MHFKCELFSILAASTVFIGTSAENSQERSQSPTKDTNVYSSMATETSDHQTTTEYPHLIPEPYVPSEMTAVVIDNFGAPYQLMTRSVPVPEPGPLEILVKVYAAGLNYVDAQMRSGQFSKLPPLPAILGKEAAGIVVKVGEKVDVSRVAIGMRVVCCFYGTGAYAEYVTCNCYNIIRFSEPMTFEEASTLYVSYMTAWRALVQRAEIKAGETVLIHGGTGGFGIAALQIAKSFGCKVVSTYGSEEGRAMLLKLGADYVHSHRLPGHIVTGMKNYSSDGYDVVLDTVAHEGLGQSVYSLKQGGRVCIIGSKGNTRLNPVSLIMEEASVYGVMLSKMNPVDFESASIEITKGIARGWVKPVIHRVYTTGEIIQAHKDLEYKEKTLGKFVLKF